MVLIEADKGGSGFDGDIAIDDYTLAPCPPALPSKIILVAISLSAQTAPMLVSGITLSNTHWWKLVVVSVMQHYWSRLIT